MKLMNSAMMPHAGQYFCEEITHDNFCEILVACADRDDLESYIGYPQNIELLKEWTGVEVPINRGMTNFKHGDQALVMKLNYRVNPKDKGRHQPRPEDFSFYVVSYFEGTDR